MKYIERKEVGKEKEEKRRRERAKEGKLVKERRTREGEREGIVRIDEEGG